MASRQEEKERRRREREEAERKAQKGVGGNRRRLGMVLGGVLAVAVAAIVVLAISAGDGASDDPASNAPNNGITNLAEAARAADCEIKENLKEEGRGHVTTTVKYQTNPPTSGAHDPAAAQDGVYAPGNPPDIEQSVHALEHGRVAFQYRAGTPQLRIDQLEGLLNEEVKGSEGYHSLLFQNPTSMPHAVAATAWRASITCAQINDQTFDALRAFRLQRVDKAPEFIP